MTLRYGLLGLLAERPASGYELTGRFTETLNQAWPASHPQIYVELRKLVEDGLATVSAEGARGRKEYTITPEGLEQVKTWLADAPIDHALRSESLFRSFFFWLMEPETLKKRLNEEQIFFESKAAFYRERTTQKDRGDFGDTPATRSARLTLEAGVRVYDALAQWAEWAREQDDAHGK